MECKPVNRNNVKLIIRILLLFTLFNNCYGNCINKKHDSCLILISNYPVLLKTNNGLILQNFLDTITFYNKNGIHVIKLPAKRIFESNKKNKNSESYFIYSESRKKGVYLTDLNDKNPKTNIDIDSFKKESLFGSLIIDTPSLVYFTKLTKFKHNEVINSYIPKKDYGENSFDSIIMHYSKNYLSYDLSLSDKLDKLNSSKLYFVRLVYKKRYSNVYKDTIPSREYFFKLGKYRISEKDTIKNILDHLEANFQSIE